MIPLSVLDLAPIAEGSSPAQSFRNSLDLANLESLEPQGRAMLEQVLSCAAIGARDTVERQLKDFIARTGADELMITSQIFEHAARLHSYDISASIAA